MEEYNHFEYGEMLAKRLKPIGHTDTEQHYYRASEIEELQELTEKASSATGMLLIAIDGNNSDFVWKDSDNLVERPQYFFALLKNVPGYTPKTLFETQKECKNVAKQIIAKMKKDGRDYSKPLQFLDENSMVIRGLGPVNDNFFGVILGFNLVYGINYLIDPEMWKEE